LKQVVKTDSHLVWVDLGNFNVYSYREVTQTKRRKNKRIRKQLEAPRGLVLKNDAVLNNFFEVRVKLNSAAIFAPCALPMR